MADEFTASGNWWDSSRNRYESGTSSSTSLGLTSMGSFGWLSDMTAAADMKSRSSNIDHSSGSNSVGFHENLHQKMNLGEGSGGGGSTLGAETNLHMMNLGLSSQTMDWNQPLLRGDKASEGSFRSMLQQENVSSNASFSQEEAAGGSGQVQWRPPSENYMLQGILGSENQQQQQHQHSGFENSRSLNNYSTSNYQPNFGMNSDDQLQLPPNWSKVPQFLRASSRKPPPPTSNTAQLHFSNNAPFWNPSNTAPPVADVKPTFFPPVQTQFSSPNFEEKPNKNLLEVNSHSSTTAVKKSGSEGSNKRPRNETQSPLPAFKVKKEKMGDRITALQQLVSPFGKTDTASVLSEAIEYIKFLHEQIHVLSAPYMKAGVAVQHHQNFEKCKIDPEGPKPDLRSRGLCLVPLSSTFPVTAHETNLDFWNPTFGGTFR